MATRTVLADEPAFIEDWESGHPLSVMARRYGISDSTVSKIARRMGLAPRASRWPNHTPVNKVYALTGGRWVPDRTGVMRWQAGPHA
jgi:hypothetical protein